MTHEQPPCPLRVAGGRRTRVSRLIAAAALAAAAMTCTPSGTQPPPTATGPFRLELTPLDELVLEDPDTPIQYLEQITLLPDGGFFSVDTVSRKVRRFDRRGRLTGTVGPPAEVQGDWQPRSCGIGGDPASLWVNDKQGRLWRFERLGEGPATLQFQSFDLGLFAIDSRDNIVSRLARKEFELAIYKDGEVVKRFFEWDDVNRSLTAKSSANLTFDPEGRIYAIRFHDPTVAVFTPQGEQIRRWTLWREHPHHRDFPVGVDLSATTHDRETLMAWNRNFTTYTKIEWVSGGRIAIQCSNDPPRRRNVLSLYTELGEHIASAEVDGYLVGARGNELYLTDQHLFYTGPCRIKRYLIPE